MTNVAKKTITPIAVCGADLDYPLVAKLTEGDMVMVEINGTRIESNIDCPLVTEMPWRVRFNNPPRMGQRPDSHTISLVHPRISHPLVLNYANLLRVQPRQPAVFREQDQNLSSTNGVPNDIFIILQMVSHIHTNPVESEFEKYDPRTAKMVLGDDELRQIVLAEWQKTLATFIRPGWSNKSVSRFALRAMVRPSVVEAIQQGRGDQLPMKDLENVHEAMHWLPMFIDQSRLQERATLEENGHVENPSTRDH